MARFTIALALSAAIACGADGDARDGGGATGFAHVGVLRRLEEHQILIAYIAGTSMGSIIGGRFTSGLSLDEIEDGSGSACLVGRA